MYEVKNYETTAENFFAGNFPIVTDHGKVKSEATIHKYAPLVQGNNGIEEITAEMITNAEKAEGATPYNLIGVAAEEPSGEEVVYYLTGEIFASALYLPSGVTADKLKPNFRKLGIFLKN